jgi:hypothetical protein
MCYKRLPYNGNVDLTTQIRQAGQQRIELPKSPKYSKEMTNLTSLLLSPKAKDRPLPCSVLRNSFVRFKWHSLSEENESASLDGTPTSKSGHISSPTQQMNIDCVEVLPDELPTSAGAYASQPIMPPLLAPPSPAAASFYSID